MPYPLDGEESESSEPTTERELPGVSMTEGLRRMQAEINRISHAALEVESPRIRTSDMAQEVAEVALAGSRAIPTLDDALMYATREVGPSAAEIMARSDRAYAEMQRRFYEGTFNIVSTTPSRPEALMHRTDRPIISGERRGPNSILYSRPFRELMRAALSRVSAHLDLWGESDIEVTEDNKLEELAERRAEAAIHKELMNGMKEELEKAQAQLSQAVVVMNNLTIDAVLREVTLTETQRQQIEAMKYEP